MKPCYLCGAETWHMLPSGVSVCDGCQRHEGITYEIKHYPGSLVALATPYQLPPISDETIEDIRASVQTRDVFIPVSPFFTRRGGALNAALDRLHAEEMQKRHAELFGRPYLVRDLDPERIAKAVAESINQSLQPLDLPPPTVTPDPQNPMRMNFEIPAINVAVVDQAGAAVDLTGARVTLAAKHSPTDDVERELAVRILGESLTAGIEDDDGCDDPDCDAIAHGTIECDRAEWDDFIKALGDGHAEIAATSAQIWCMPIADPGDAPPGGSRAIAEAHENLRRKG